MIQRYKLSVMNAWNPIILNDDNGVICKYEDVEALETELAEVKAERDRLKNYVEILAKAGLTRAKEALEDNHE